MQGNIGMVYNRLRQGGGVRSRVGLGCGRDRKREDSDPNGIYKLLQFGYWRELKRLEIRLKSEMIGLRIWKGMVFGNGKA